MALQISKQAAATGQNQPPRLTPGIQNSQFLQTNPSATDFLQRGEGQVSRPGFSQDLQGAGLQLGTTIAGTLQGSGNLALQQALGQLNQILQSGGQLPPEVIAQLTRGVSRGTQQNQLQAQESSARSGIRTPASLGLETGIANAGASRQTGLEAQLAQQAQNRLMQALGLTGSLVTNPSLGFAQIGQGALNQQNAIEAQQGDPLLQALGFGAQGAATFFGGPAGGALMANKFPDLFGPSGGTG